MENASPRVSSYVTLKATHLKPGEYMQVRADLPDDETETGGKWLVEHIAIKRLSNHPQRHVLERLLISDVKVGSYSQFAAAGYAPASLFCEIPLALDLTSQQRPLSLSMLNPTREHISDIEFTIKYTQPPSHLPDLVKSQWLPLSPTPKNKHSNILSPDDTSANIQIEPGEEIVLTVRPQIGGVVERILMTEQHQIMLINKTLELKTSVFDVGLGYEVILGSERQIFLQDASSSRYGGRALIRTSEMLVVKLKNNSDRPITKLAATALMWSTESFNYAPPRPSLPYNGESYYSSPRSKQS